MSSRKTIKESFNLLPVWIKIILGSLSFLFVNSLASGFWEKITSPLLSYTSNILFNFLTSSSNRFSNFIYQEVSKSSLNSQISTISSAILVILVFVIIESFFRHKEELEKIEASYLTDIDRLTEKPSQEVDSNKYEGKSIEEMEEIIKSLDEKIIQFKNIMLAKVTRINKLKTLVNVNLFFILIIFVIPYIYSQMKYAYTYQKLESYHRYLIMAKPNLSNSEEEAIDARFLDIRSKSDYDSIINLLISKKYVSNSR